jgi:hypothetical protein
MRYPTLDSAKADLFDYIERFHIPRMRRQVAKYDMKLSTGHTPDQWTLKANCFWYSQGDFIFNPLCG